MRLSQYGYLGALAACFIFAMGNRPQGCVIEAHDYSCQVSLEIQVRDLLLRLTHDLVSGISGCR